MCGIKSNAKHGGHKKKKKKQWRKRGTKNDGEDEKRQYKGVYIVEDMRRNIDD